MSQPALRAAAPAILLAVVVLAPFLGTAYTIDDPLFLYQARHVLEDPLHPTAFIVNWSTAPQRMSALMASGPGMAYLLAPTLLLGGAEWAAHLTQLALLVLALWSTASLALRLGVNAGGARAASLLLASAPAVLGMSATAMPDIAAMAFGVLGVERSAAWGTERRWAQAIGAAVALGAAALCRLQTLPIVAVALLVGGTPLRSWRAWVPPVAAPLLAGLVLVVTHDPSGQVGAVAGAARTFVFAPAMLRNVVSYFVHLVLVLPLALPWLALRPRPILRSPILYAGAGAAWLYARSTPEVGPAWAALLAGFGAAAVSDLVIGAIRGRDGTPLALGVWILTPLAVVPYLHLPSKYLLPAAPAIALAVVRARTLVSPRRARAVVTVTVIASVGLGLLILRADARLAGLGRRAAAELVVPRVASGKNVWFNGHWGFQWYAEKAGARSLTSVAPHPRWGDVVIATSHAEDELMGAMPNKRLVTSLEDGTPGGRTMSREGGAGFFSNGWGYLPWAWGSDPVDRYDVWSIEPPSTPRN